MNSKYNLYDGAVTVLGIGFTAEKFETAIGIIIGILTLCNILIKISLAIKSKIDEKKFKEIPAVIEDGIEKLEEVKNNGKNK